MQLALDPARRRTYQPAIHSTSLRERLAEEIESAALDLLDPERIEMLAEDMRVIERRRMHHAGLIVGSLILSAMQRSTDTEGRWLDAQRTYEDLGGAEGGKTAFRAQVRKLVPVMRELLRRRLCSIAAASADVELRGRLRAFADVLIPDGSAFKLAAALSHVYAGTGQPAEFKLHAVYSVRAGGVTKLERTAGSVHDSDGFRPATWMRDALYIWDLAFVSHDRFVAAASAGAHVLQRLKTGANPIVTASYGPTGAKRDLRREDGRPLRLNDACAFGDVHRQHVLDLDVEITNDAGSTVTARVVCVPFGEDRYYLTTLPRAVFTPHDVAELYRIRWEIELFFRGWKGALRLDEVKRLQHPLSLDAAITASLLAATFAQKITNAVNALERRGAAEAIFP
jgi:hypothetical protein